MPSTRPPPLRDLILSFSQMFLPKSTLIGGPRPHWVHAPPTGIPGSATVKGQYCCTNRCQHLMRRLIKYFFPVGSVFSILNFTNHLLRTKINLEKTLVFHFTCRILLCFFVASHCTISSPPNSKQTKGTMPLFISFKHRTKGI